MVSSRSRAHSLALGSPLRSQGSVSLTVVRWLGFMSVRSPHLVDPLPASCTSQVRGVMGEAGTVEL